MKTNSKSRPKISESRGEFLEKLQRARGQVKSDLVSQPILSRPNTVSLMVGNWSFACQKENELSIYNSDGQQTTILCEDLPGFVFESNRGTRHMFTADTSLGAEFASGWSGKPGKKFVSKAEALKLKVKTTARDVQEKYFQMALSSPREVVTKLQDIVRNLYACCDAHEKNLDVSL
jgi:E3 ubiquitin-protein ligase HECTD1